MTSKNLFFNLMKEELKQKLWVIASAALLLFFVFPITTLLMIENGYILDDINGGVFARSVTLNNPFITLVSLIIAFLFAMQSFSYLHSKKQIDLYHGIPVKRELLFSVKYVSGIVLYLILLITFACTSLGILAAKGVSVWEKAYLSLFCRMLVVTVVFYLLMYTIMIIGVLFSGSKVISVFSIFTLMMYGPILFAIWQFVTDKFRVTQYMANDAWEAIKWTSPMFLYIMTAAGGEGMQGGELSIAVILPIVIILTVLLLILAVKLHKKRNSESAGKAIAFSVSEPVFKVLLVTPISFLGGIMFSMLSSNEGISWYVFGVILSYLIGNAFIEIVFAFDFRKAFSHKKIWILNGVIIAAVNLFFILDIGGYDSYMPEEDKIESMAVEFNFQGSNFGNQNNYIRDKNGNYSDITELHLENMKLEEFGELYRLTEEKVVYLADKGRLQPARLNGMMPNSYYEGSMIVGYHLKNGKEVYRKYQIDFQKDADSVARIFETPEYLTAAHGVSNEESYDRAYYSRQYQTDEDRTQLPMNEEELKELARLYKEDIVGLKLDLNKEMLPVGTILLTNSENGAERFYYVYPFCRKTIAYMQQAAEGNILIEEALKAENVISVVASLSEDPDIVTTYSSGGFRYLNNYDVYKEMSEETEVWDITDPLLIQEILEEGILLEYGYGNPFWQQSIDTKLTVEINYFTDSLKNTESVTLCFQSGELFEAIKAAK